LAFHKSSNTDIAKEIGLSRKQVGLWRRRWQASFDALVDTQCRESHAALVRLIEDVLSDAPRSGAPPTYTAEQVTQILAIACEDPQLSKRPVTHWTPRELTDEAIQRGIVESISISQVARYLEQADLQPHKNQQWLNTKEKDSEAFQQQVETVCQAYLDAPQLYHRENTHTVSVDEMTGVQALERIAPTIPMKSGRPERFEFEYKRHGTLCLIANWHVVIGQMIAPTIGPTRKEEDFQKHVSRTVATDPDAGWRFMVDRLNTHCSESLVRWVADLEGLDPASLGKKGKFGILKSMASRTVFLSDTSHRVHFIYLPKHTSWLNQIEIIFSIVTRRVLRRGDFRSLEDLEERLRNFIDYFNRTFAKPFNWTYPGRPVKAVTLKRPKIWKAKWISRSKDRKRSSLAGSQL